MNDYAQIVISAIHRVIPTEPEQTIFSSTTSHRPDKPGDDGIPSQLSPPQDDEASYEGTKEELEQAIEGSNDILVKANTILALTPDKVVLDRAKLTITKRNFVRAAEIMSIRIEDVLNVTATVGPIFGNINVASRVINSGPFIVGRFTRQDALKLKRITQGYVIALQREIDCNTIPTAELIELLEQLGEDNHSASSFEASHSFRSS